MATVAELQAMVVDQLRRLRLEEKRLRVGALGYDAGEFAISDLVMVALRYATEVRVYREMEAALLSLGVAVPRAVREGGTRAEDWQSEMDVETTQPCAVRQGTTLQ